MQRPWQSKQKTKLLEGSPLAKPVKLRHCAHKAQLKREALSAAHHAIVLRNGSPRDVSVTVVENIPGDWTMLSESQSHTKESAGQAAWDVAIPAGGKTELTYRVRTRF